MQCLRSSFPDRDRRNSLRLLLGAVLISACGNRRAAMCERQFLPEPGAALELLWSAHFDRPPLQWTSPSGAGPRALATVYSVLDGPGASCLHARHDARSGLAPACHYGKSFKSAPVPLELVKCLRWRWRVLQHPAVGADRWLDLAASIYVIVQAPSLLQSGRGFKFGWLTAGPPSAGWQRGLLQVPLRHEPASERWRSEQIDLCGLYRQTYGPCEGQNLLYIGVLSDADGTRSLAVAQYADFELLGIGR